jgi:hypothetical protein
VGKVGTTSSDSRVDWVGVCLPKPRLTNAETCDCKTYLVGSLVASLRVLLARGLLSVVETPAKVNQSLGDLLPNSLRIRPFAENTNLIRILLILPENPLNPGDNRCQVMGVAKHQGGSLLKSENLQKGVGETNLGIKNAVYLEGDVILGLEVFH